MSLPTFPEDAIYEAVLSYLAVRAPVFRATPIGAPGSPARDQQTAEIAAEDRLLAVMYAYRLTTPGQNTGGRL